MFGGLHSFATPPTKPKRRAILRRLAVNWRGAEKFGSSDSLRRLAQFFDVLPSFATLCPE
jgi:hypothetical protein